MRVLLILLSNPLTPHQQHHCASVLFFFQTSTESPFMHCTASQPTKLGGRHVKAYPGVIDQGPPNGGVSNGGVSRSGLVLPFLSFFVLLGLSRGFSRFVRGLSGDFPDWSFSSFSASYQHLQGTVPKASATQSGPFPKKAGNTRVWKHPGLASLKLSYQSQFFVTFR